MEPWNETGTVDVVNTQANFDVSFVCVFSKPVCLPELLSSYINKPSPNDSMSRFHFVSLSSTPSSSAVVDVVIMQP